MSDDINLELKEEMTFSLYDEDSNQVTYFRVRNDPVVGMMLCISPGFMQIIQPGDNCE